MLALFEIPLLAVSWLFSASVRLIISLLLRCLLEKSKPKEWQNNKERRKYTVFASVSRISTKERIKRRTAMLYTNVCPRSQFKTILFTSKKEKTKNKERGGGRDDYPLCTLVLWRCLLKTVLFTSKSNRAALYSAPSLDLVKQTELASLRFKSVSYPPPPPPVVH